MAEINENQEEKNALDITLLLRDCLRGLRKFWIIGLAMVVLMAAFGGIRSARSYVPMYRCQASFTVNTVQSGSSDGDYSYSFYYDQTTASQMAATFPYILRSNLLMDLLKEDLGVSWINGSITASSVANSNLFVLTVTGTDAKATLSILEAVIRNYPRVAQYVIGDTQLNMIAAPRLPEAPYNELEWVSSAVKYGVLGALAFAALLVVYALLRNTVRRESEITDKLQMNSLGTVPAVVFKQHTGKVDRSLSIKNEKTGTAFQESIRSIALEVAARVEETPRRVIGVTAAAAGEGASTVAKNLAAALAERGKRVILIKADLMSGPKTPKAGKPGLEQYLMGSCDISDVLVQDKKHEFWTAACSRRLTQQEAVSCADALGTMVSGAAQAVDYVILDMPSGDRLSALGQIAELCTAMVFVIRQDNLKLGRIMDTVDDLSRYDAQMLGCVLTFTQGGVMGYGYGGYSGYGRYGRYGAYGSYGYGKRYGAYGQPKKHEKT